MQPVAPMGWPSATAPPLGFTFAGSSPRSFVTAIACTANASLDSITSMSAGLRPAFSKTFLTAGVGIGDEPRHRLQFVLFRERRRSQNKRGARVVDAGSIARRHGAVLLE